MISMRDLVDKSVFKDLDKSAFWLRVYNTTCIPHSSFHDILKHIINEISFKNSKLSIHCLGITGDGPELQFIKQDLPYSNPYGTLTISSEFLVKKLPAGTYVFLATPYKIDDQKGDEFITKTCLNEAESILSLYLGNNFLHSIVFDGEMALTDKGSATIPGPPIAIPQKCDGPFLSKDNWDAVLETFQKINNITDPDKVSRVNLALRFFQKGKNTFNDDESFFLYWTAIIALLEESRTMYINQKLQVLYSMSKEDVEDKLMWKWAYEVRNDILHNAKSVVFHMQIERYFQLLFLDLLRGELGLECKKFLENYLTSSPEFFK